MKNLFLKFFNQLPLRITLLILIFSFIMIGFFFINSKSNFKEYLKENAPNLYNIIRNEIIYPIFKQKVLGASLVEKIPLIRVILSRKDVAHFA
ncbi:uncharacterized protein METZ01_LOCUS239489, partial [marine metagenome]